MIVRPHDALFKSAFEAPAAAASLLCEILPAAIADAIAWSSLTRDSGSFVTAQLADLHGDLLFTARRTDGDPKPLYILLEHQSTEDLAMPLRALRYQTQVWDRHRQADPAPWLPLILVVVVSHALAGWTAARAFEEMFDPRLLAVPGLPSHIPHYSLIVDDLARQTDDALKARALAAFQRVVLWMLRDGRNPVRLLDSFENWADPMLQVARSPDGEDAFRRLNIYLFRVIHPAYHNALRDRLRWLGTGAKDIPMNTAMTIADELHEEGRKEGIKEGIKEGVKKGRREGIKRGRKQGREQGIAQGRVASLRSLLTLKFHALDAAYQAKLEAAPPDAIDRYLARVLFADSLAAVFADERGNPLLDGRGQT